MYTFRVRCLIKYLVLAMLLATGGGPGWLAGLHPFEALPLVQAADAGPAANRGGVSAIQHIDLVHLSHTDVGFTDHPIICRELQRRYLDIAIDAVLATPRPARIGPLLLDGRERHRRQ